VGLEVPGLFNVLTNNNAVWPPQHRGRNGATLRRRNAEGVPSRGKGGGPISWSPFRLAGKMSVQEVEDKRGESGQGSKRRTIFRKKKKRRAQVYGKLEKRGETRCAAK